jgi:hypothetical protein
MGMKLRVTLDIDATAFADERIQTFVQELFKRKIISVRQAAERRETKRERNAKLDVGFDQFYEAYPPKRKNRTRALSAWRTTQAYKHLDVILQRLEQHKQSQEWQVQNGRYVCAPARWLSDRKWEDKDNDYGPTRTTRANTIDRLTGHEDVIETTSRSVPGPPE